MAVTTSRGLDPHPTDQRTLRTFFVATFALSWGVGVLSVDLSAHGAGPGTSGCHGVRAAVR